MNYIGLNEKEVNLLCEKLNKLLSNYQIFYQNVRGFHWNIKGEKFFELHVKFEELYNNLQIKIDEIAERILTLGQVPIHTYSDYLKSSEIIEAKNISSANNCVEIILECFSICVKIQRDILIISDKSQDEGTNALMSDYIREQEKLIWMFRSFLNK